MYSIFVVISVNIGLLHIDILPVRIPVFTGDFVSHTNYMQGVL